MKKMTCFVKTCLGLIFVSYITSCSDSEKRIFTAHPAVGVEDARLDDDTTTAEEKLKNLGLFNKVTITELTSGGIHYFQIKTKDIIVGSCGVSIGSKIEELLKCDFCKDRDYGAEENIKIKLFKEGISCRGVSFIINKNRIEEIYIHKDYITYKHSSN